MTSRYDNQCFRKVLLHRNMLLVLGILIGGSTFGHAWLMPWPVLPSRIRRDADSLPSLQVLLSHPLNKERPAVTLLQDGLAHDEILEKIEKIRLPPEFNLDPIYQLFSMKNGIPLEKESQDLEAIYLIPGYYLLSLDEACTIYTDRSRSSDGKLKTNESYGSRDVLTNTALLFPIMSSGKEQFVFVDLHDGSIKISEGKGSTYSYFEGLEMFFKHYTNVYKSDKKNNVDDMTHYKTKFRKPPGKKNSLLVSIISKISVYH